MSSDDTINPSVEQQLEIAGAHMLNAFQAVQLARQCATQVSVYSNTSEPYAPTISEKKRVAAILTKDVEQELAKALSTLNSAISAQPLSTLKKSE